MDEGHRLTELVLRETETDITQVYRKATDEVQKKLDDYFRRFKVKDENKRSLLKEGKITQDEYDYWRTGQIMVGKRWEEMKNTLAQDLHNSNNIARSIVNGHMPEVYAINHNYGTFQVEKGSMVNTSYTLYDRHTVERIIRDQPDLLPLPGEQMKKTFKDFDAYKRGEEVKGLSDKTKKAFDKYISGNKDVRWQKGQIQSVTLQSILQGESIPNMARRIAREMGEINRNASIRYARTATTGAENAGRVDAYKRAKDMGIDMEQEWIATMDKRTRHGHRQLDGERAQVGEKFSNGCRFPGDPEGPANEIWNCRCTLGAAVSGWEDMSGKFRSDKALEGMTYDEWKGERKDADDYIFDTSVINSVRVRGDAIPKNQIDMYVKMTGATSMQVGSDTNLRINNNYNNVRVSYSTDVGNVAVIFKPDVKEIEIDDLFINTQGQGIGSRVFEEIKTAAKHNGYNQITLFAAGDAKDVRNGYYTWARFGFDANLDSGLMQAAAKDGYNVSTVGELMKTEDGRRWWKKNGHGMRMVFKLR